MRIVLVDPSRAVQRAMTKLIEEGGHEVIVFADGIDALEHVARDPDVRTLISSTQPFRISGIELCNAARKLSGTRRALHVILMSASDDYHLAVTALDNGADDFINKPPNPDELRARLRLADRVTAMKQQLIVFATTDSLTGLLNRRAFFDAADEMCLAAAGGQPLAAIMFDVDHFKRVNDSHGHEMGDRVLAAIGTHAKVADGLAGRLGGEEFGVLVYGEAQDALAWCGGVQRAIRAQRFQRGGASFGVTCSFGITEWEDDDTIDRALRRADLALYEAKRSGRDRIVAADTFALTPGHDQWQGAARVGGRR
jgi:two-component system, cell cycle response regulator